MLLQVQVRLRLLLLVLRDLIAAYYVKTDPASAMGSGSFSLSISSVVEQLVSILVKLLSLESIQHSKVSTRSFYDLNSLESKMDTLRVGFHFLSKLACPAQSRISTSSYKAGDR